MTVKLSGALRCRLGLWFVSSTTTVSRTRLRSKETGLVGNHPFVIGAVQVTATNDEVVFSQQQQNRDDKVLRLRSEVFGVGNYLADRRGLAIEFIRFDDPWIRVVH